MKKNKFRLCFCGLFLIVGLILNEGLVLAWIPDPGGGGSGGSGSEDMDGDGICRMLEDMSLTSDYDTDSDDDGLNDYTEIMEFPTYASNPDSDNNGLLDGEDDLDNDSYSNADEIYVYHTDPEDDNDHPNIDHEWTIMWYCNGNDYQTDKNGYKTFSMTSKMMEEIYGQIQDFRGSSSMDTFWDKVSITMLVNHYKGSIIYPELTCSPKYIRIVDGTMFTEDWSGSLSESDTLENFIVSSKMDCPAKKYLLCFTSHGQGQFQLQYNNFNDVPGGICPNGASARQQADGSYNYYPQDTLTSGELQSALNDKNVDIVTLGCCYSGAIEYVGALKDNVNYYISTETRLAGSDNSEAYSHPLIFYDNDPDLIGLLEALNTDPTISVDDFAVDVCDVIGDYVDDNYETKPQIISLFDLSMWGDFDYEFSRLSSALKNGYNDQLLSNMIGYLPNFPNDMGKSLATNLDHDHIYDLGEMLDYLSEHSSGYIHDKAYAALSYYEDIISYTKTANWDSNWNWCTGLSIYVPKSGTYWYPNAYSSVHMPWATEVGWFEVLDYKY